MNLARALKQWRSLGLDDPWVGNPGLYASKMRKRSGTDLATVKKILLLAA